MSSDSFLTAASTSPISPYGPQSPHEQPKYVPSEAWKHMMGYKTGPHAFLPGNRRTTPLFPWKVARMSPRSPVVTVPKLRPIGQPDQKVFVYNPKLELKGISQDRFPAPHILRAEPLARAAPLSPLVRTIVAVGAVVVVLMVEDCMSARAASKAK